MATASPQSSASTWLERALIFTVLAHALAMLSMAFVLAPMLPGGIAPDSVRIATIATHPWRFRLGWLPWQLTALSDVLVGVALVRTPWIPRAAAWSAMLFTAIAVIPDQGGEALWITKAVAFAQRATREGRPDEFLHLEAEIYRFVAGWAALFYTLGAVAWSVCFARAKTWNKTLTAISSVLWPLFAFAAVLPLVRWSHPISGTIIGASNAVGFVLLEVWLVRVTELVLRRARPDDRHGRWAPWRHPETGMVARALEVAANSRFVRALCAWLPVPGFRSEIRNVVYVNYVVAFERLEKFVPEGLELQRIGPAGRFAAFTFLTYRHGHFGPTRLGPLRGLFASPVQTNWRTYVRDPRTGLTGIYFVTNAIDSGLHALGARMMSEGMPMHRIAHADLDRDDATGAIRVTIDPGRGTAPDARLDLVPAASSPMSDDFRACFASVHEALAYLVTQDRAMSSQPWQACTSREEIDLGIPLERCEPLRGTVESKAAREIVGDAEAWCFRVPEVSFVFRGEVRDAWSARGHPSRAPPPTDGPRATSPHRITIADDVETLPTVNSKTRSPR